MATVIAVYVGGRRAGRPHEIDDSEVGSLHVIAPDRSSLDGSSDVYRTERRANGSVIHRHVRTLRRGEGLADVAERGEGIRRDERSVDDATH